jgi:hypothetical protein
VVVQKAASRSVEVAQELPVQSSMLSIAARSKRQTLPRQINSCYEQRLQLSGAEVKVLPIGVEGQNCLDAHTLAVGKLDHRARERIFGRKHFKNGNRRAGDDLFNGKIRIRQSNVRDAVIPIGNLYSEFRGHPDIPFQTTAREELNNFCLPIRMVPFAIRSFFDHPVGILGIRLLRTLQVHLKGDVRGLCCGCNESASIQSTRAAAAL